MTSPAKTEADAMTATGREVDLGLGRRGIALPEGAGERGVGSSLLRLLLPLRQRAGSGEPGTTSRCSGTALLDQRVKA